MPILSRLLLSGALLLVAQPLSSQQPDRRDAHQVADSLELVRLAHELTRAARSDSARAAAIYEWVARNVAWDVDAYRRRKEIAGTAEAVYRRRVALCGGYVALYARLAKEAGLVVEPVEGYAKGFDYRHGQRTGENNHAWLAVLVDGRWRLVDPTWGSGHVMSGRFVRDFSWAYFLVPSEQLILSHFPEDSRWQLVQQPLARRDFERMPAVPRALFEVGFTPAAVRVSALSSRDFPRVGSQPAAVQVLRAPLSGTVAQSTLIELDLIWPGVTEVALVSGEVWTQLSRSGDRFHGAAPAAASAVYVVGRSSADPREYVTLLHYTVR